MLKIFLDSSVILSGINSPTGASAAILSLVNNGRLVGFISPLVTKEVLNNLQKKFSPKILAKFILYLPTSKLQKVDFENEEEVTKYRNTTVSKDVHVVAGAYKSNTHYLLTLDKKHLLSIKTGNLPFKIISPKGFLQAFLNSPTTNS